MVSIQSNTHNSKTTELQCIHIQYYSHHCNQNIIKLHQYHRKQQQFTQQRHYDSSYENDRVQENMENDNEWKQYKQQQIDRIAAQLIEEQIDDGAAGDAN